jgi:site-specific DNA recombinase
LNRSRQPETDLPLQTTVRPLRCAIYTRKSTDEGLDQEFNSLDAQRESAEAFILSQRGEGLVALPERYDDGGFSGGNLDRPALERLLADIRCGGIECVVVYKVDRLSRSLIDFARIVEIFEKHNVSFVSVTQHFNTTNSLGRLTLNILLSFAQFEREIIAERTRDKLSAARRRGKWIGGRPVLGYDIAPRSRLVVNADEAFQVRTMFELYLDYNALAPVAIEANRRGWRTKQWVTKHGVPQGGKPFTKGRIFRLLTNPIYSGKVGFRNQIYDGEHEAIVTLSTCEEVHRILSSNGHDGGRDVRRGSCVVPRDLLRCACCEAKMLLTRSSRALHGRHFVCAQARRRICEVDNRTPVAESTVVGAIVDEIRALIADPRVIDRVVAKTEDQMHAVLENLTFERGVTLRALAGLPVNTRADHQERRIQMEMRLDEIDKVIESLQSETRSTDVLSALAQFWPVWLSLNSRERVRIVSVFIRRLTFNGKTAMLSLDCIQNRTAYRLVLQERSS